MTVEERLARLETKTDAQDVVLDRISRNVESLLETRAFARGAAKMAFWVSTTVSSVIGLVFTALSFWRH